MTLDGLSISSRREVGNVGDPGTAPLLIRDWVVMLFAKPSRGLV